LITFAREPFSLADISAADQASAQTLFDAGRRLIAQGNFVEACPKFLESQRLDPGVGTLLNLADCYEHIGRLASAWTNFLDAAGLAHSSKEVEREKMARERAALLEPRLSKLTIAVSPDSDVPDLEIKRDGSLVGRVSWNIPMPVDAGTYSIEAKARGKKPWRTSIEVRGEGAEVGTTIRLEDSLEVLASAHSDEGAAPETPHPSDGRTQRTVALVVGGAGLVGLGLGAIFAVNAKSRYDESRGNCNPQDPNRCNPSGLDQRDSARSMGNAATVAVSLGAAALATGTILYFVAPTLDSRGAGAGVAIGGVF
jgi:hypothetical protein